MIPSPSKVRQDLYDDLASLSDETAISGVYDYMPGGEVTGPVYIGIDVTTIGPEEIEVTVAIFSQGADDWRSAALRLDVATEIVNDRIESVGWDSPTWNRDVLDQIGLLVAHCQMKRGREDMI